MITTATRVLAAMLVTTAAASSTAAFAHAETAHDKKPAVAKMEQTDWGIAGDSAKGIRTVELKMTDNMRFSPDHVNVKQGETVRFVVRNNGQLMHEFVIGTPRALDEHAALMVKFPAMEHSEAYMAHVPPGKVGEVVWVFNRAGEFRFACLIAGHYQAGMVGTIKVAAK